MILFARSSGTPIVSGDRTSDRRLAGLETFSTSITASVFLALCAHISFALPFTPIPVTMQTFAVLFLGMFLGPYAGAMTMVLYLAEGAIGLPVFSPHGVGGLAQLLGPSAGYLLSYPFAAMVAGHIFSSVRKFSSIFVAVLMASFVADALILLTGCAWLMNRFGGSSSSALATGMFPFVVGEACKIILLACTMTTLRYAHSTR